MEFFDKLGKKASEAYKITADKTGKLAKEAKLRLKIGDLKSQINNIYEEIGKKVYQNHVDSSTIDLEKEIEESCTKIDLLSEEIEMKLKECLELRDRKQCPNCFTEMDRDVKFCPECGAKQEVIEEETQIAKEVEIIEKEDNMNIQNNVEEQNDINEEDASQDNSIDEIEENNGAERNTEGKNMEENSIDENNIKENSENEQENEDNEHKENLQKTVEVESNIDTDIQVSESENDENK